MSDISTPGKFKLVWVAPSLIALVTALVCAWFFWGRSHSDVKWRTAQIELGPISVSVTATGTLQAVLTVQVGTQVSGTVSAIYADFNSEVKKGQVIARIDSTLLRAALTDAMSNQERTGAQQRQASEELKRSQALFARALISQSELDQSIANAHVASANLNSAKAQVDRARINLKYATIVSPIDGTVLSRAVDVGQTVAASFNTPTLFTLAGDLKQMQVQASVDEADIGKIAKGQKATFTVDAYPDSVFMGEVRQIRLQPVTVQNVVSYDVVISVPNPHLKLMPGMTASLSIVVARKDVVMLAPALALRFSPPDLGGKKSRENKSPGMASDRIFVLENGQPKPVNVQVGLSDGIHTEISGSVEAGTLVITGMESTAASKQTKAAPFGVPRTPGRSGGGGARYH